jgi:hypothetical protein
MKKGIMTTCFALVFGAVVALAATYAYADAKATLPPNNPFLIQNSVYPSIHFDSAQIISSKGAKT